MVRSPYVGDLLNGILHRGEDDARALKLIAQSVLGGPDSGFTCVEVKGRDLFPLSRQDMFRFLRESGIEKWHASTWLSVGEDGVVESDAPLAPVSYDHGADARLAALTESVWRTYAISTSPVVLEGVEVQVFSLPRMGSLLDTARDIARRNPDWSASTLMQSMRAVMVNGRTHDGPDSGGTALESPQRGRKPR